ncbi:MAG TPA: hypothetical protein VJB15_10685, partial [Rhodothermia bacterium]|nr:hypothetical protein [Rhodothermia bacterium]
MSLNYNAAVNISAHYSGEAAINRANRDIHSLSGTVKGAASLFKAFAAAYLVRETLQFGKSIINLGDSLNELRQKTGIGVQALSDLKTAAEK